jgi:uncharacterized membrane protein YoaK (UPF0700 family)
MADTRGVGLLNSALLASVGGFLDCFSYVGHGHVFACAMTGNVVLLGAYALAKGRAQSLAHLPPILAFLLGVGAAKAILLPREPRLVRRPYPFILLAEMAILLGVSFLPKTTSDLWISATVAFAAALQVEAFRVVDDRSFNSTFTTGNLRAFSAGAFEWLFKDKRAEARIKVRDFGTISLMFFVGAVAGAWATRGMGNSALWIDVALLAVVMVRLRSRQILAAD